MNLHIRKANQNDLPKIKEGLINSWIEHARQEPELLDEEQMRTVDVESYYRNAFASDSIAVLVAEVDGEFAGVLRADKSTIPLFFKDNQIAYLDDGYVAPEYRGRGVIRALIKEMEGVVRNWGVKRIQARVYAFNTPIHKALSQCGYRMPHGTWDKVLK